MTNNAIVTAAVLFVNTLLDYNDKATPAEIGECANSKFANSTNGPIIAVMATLYACALARGVNPARAEYDLRA
jgi:hypothetical protein